MNTTFNNAINFALSDLMQENKEVIVWGPGSNDPKAVFGTTHALREKFGHDRVFDGPISEAEYTGHALGLSLCGFFPIIHFQRVDFSFMAWDQIVNNISKWSSMFGENIETPLIIRVIQGRGWGQGQQHSQNPIRMLTSFPGLQVFTPVTPSQCYSAFHTAYQEKKPTLIYEHRWLQGLEEVEFQKERLLNDTTEYMNSPSNQNENKGKEDLTLLSYSYGIIECLRAKKVLEKAGLKVKVLGVNRFDHQSHQRVQELFGDPKKAIIFDLSWRSNSPLKDYLQLRENHNLRYITLEDNYTPTSFHQTGSYYPTAIEIIKEAKEIFSLDIPIDPLRGNHDQPLNDSILNEVHYS